MKEYRIVIDGKRLEAAALKGVSYDARSDRFTAEIYIDGSRNWLGSYATAQEASAAYIAARKERGPIRRQPTSFAQLYAAFREHHGGDGVEPPFGATLEYDGQKFTYAGDAWRQGAGGRNLRYGRWDSTCSTCGADYQTLAPFSPSIAKGITRNCPDHTRGRRAKTALKRVETCAPAVDDEGVEGGFCGGAEAERQEPPRESPQEAQCWIMAAVLERLALVHDRMPLSDVARHLSHQMFAVNPEASAVGVGKALERWADGEFSTDAPFRVEDGLVVFV